MKLNENELDKVAGGKIAETKEGKFILMPPNAKEFTTKEEAEEAEKNFLNSRHDHGHHFGHHFGHRFNHHNAKDAIPAVEPAHNPIEETEPIKPE